MKLAIVTISYNGSKNIAGLLNSLSGQTDRDFEMIVIDNGSKADDLQNLETVISRNRPDFKELHFIKSDKNLGFSGGNNLGIEKALKNGADWVLLLNDDTETKNDFIASVKANLSDKEGIVGLGLDEGTRIARAGRIEWLKPTLKHIYNPEISLSDSIQSYAIGAAVLINKKVFEKIGPMDEDYFLYFEDADFSARAREAGSPITFLPQIIVKHKVSESTAKLGSPNMLRYHYRNAFRFNLRNGPLYIKLSVGAWALAVFIKQLIKISLRKNIPESKAILNGVRDFYAQRMGKIQ